MMVYETHAAEAEQAKTEREKKREELSIGESRGGCEGGGLSDEWTRAI